MSQKLILIRGNSGSGKSTVASRVRAQLPGKVMFLQQDVLRRDILKVEDKEGNPGVGLARQLVLYGKEQGYDVLLEGIFSKKKYGDMFHELLPQFDETFVYYFDIPFEETLRRHSTRDKTHDFGESEMREWWLEKDYLGIEGEQILGADVSEDALVEHILDDITQ
jgi:thymidylate kinase